MDVKGKFLKLLGRNFWVTFAGEFFGEFLDEY